MVSDIIAEASRYFDFALRDEWAIGHIANAYLIDGFLRQHTIVASRNGKTAHIPAVLRVYVEAGRIFRIEEYFDRGQLDSALAA